MDAPPISFMHEMAEFEQAKAEHEKALAEVAAMRAKVAVARSEYKQAEQTVAGYELDMQRAAEQISVGLEQLQLASFVTQSLVEYHSNIGSYQCYLVTSDAKYEDIKLDSLHVDVQFPLVRLLKDGESWWETQIERNVDQASCVISIKVSPLLSLLGSESLSISVVYCFAVQEDHINMRLPVQINGKEPLGGVSSFSQVDVKELEAANYSCIVCRSCDESLLRGTDIVTKVLPLPSANWMDMFDFWGAGIGAFEHIPREGINAGASRVYVGESHLLLHEQDFASGAIENAVTKRAEKKVDTDWQPICCAKCKIVLGSRLKVAIETIRLDKHVIGASATPKDEDQQLLEDIFARYTIDSVVVAKLLELADADGIFRYRLHAMGPAESDTKAEVVPDVLLQLLSWETKIQSSQSLPNFQRVLKVLFSTQAPSEKTEPASSQAPLMLMPLMRDHEVVFPCDVIEAVTDRLRKSNSLLPQSQQQFNNMSFGYLFV